MAVIKLNVSLDAAVVETLRRRAAEEQKPASRYLADLVTDDAKRHRDALAEEGYRLLGEDTLRFAEEAWPTTAEGWPAWNAGADGGSAPGDAAP